MDEIGTILREAREARELSLADVQAKTRIAERYLVALEEGRYDVLPTAVHTRGYLRNYARALALDPEPLLERLAASKNAPAPANGDPPAAYLNDAKPIPELGNQPFFNPVNMEVDGTFGTDSTESKLRLAIIIALIVAIALVANRFIPLVTGNGDGTAALQDAIIELVNSPEETATPGVESNLFMDSESASGDQLVNPTSRTTAGVGDEPLPTPTRPALPATMERINLRIDITERTWLEVTIDGEVVLSGLLTRGDGPYEWEALQEARILTGGASGVFVTINDIEWGFMGDRGAVAEQAWQTTGN